ncbi:MAG: hypothetical protein N839_0014220 [Desulfofustis sp. PB-SRB1]|mgnify:CR=1 FL=1|jgi:hypothetical protein|nr:hypothetical protein [Desulfofustis sp. PB-SRB1]MBM1003549.1 hypothetical protein [Desulfofustis sp. PB-SRB1]HBH28337.1 hypothetical protein [Desulfofustis sp.]HBH30865.1 hypothetical protein [Desulfofustis sp.]
MFTEQEVIKAQQAWGNGIVRIGSLKADVSAAVKAAEEHLDTLYAFELGDVLFKPTKCAQVQFRLGKIAALSYFVGGNSDYPEDTGFAINPWTAVRFENAAIILEENRAIAMGNYWFTDLEGNETKVEYTFGYKKDSAGKVKIDLHHSSIPFSG